MQKGAGKVRRRQNGGYWLKRKGGGERGGR